MLHIQLLGDWVESELDEVKSDLDEVKSDLDEVKSNLHRLKNISKNRILSPIKFQLKTQYR